MYALIWKKLARNLRNLNLPVFSKLAVEFFEVGGRSREGVFDGDGSNVVKHSGQFISLGCLQDGQLVVGLTCARNKHGNWNCTTLTWGRNMAIGTVLHWLEEGAWQLELYYIGLRKEYGNWNCTTPAWGRNMAIGTECTTLAWGRNKHSNWICTMFAWKRNGECHPGGNY